MRTIAIIKIKVYLRRTKDLNLAPGTCYNRKEWSLFAATSMSELRFFTGKKTAFGLIKWFNEISNLQELVICDRHHIATWIKKQPPL